MSVKILIVDDHSIVRDGLKKILECHDGFLIVSEAANGHEAIDRAVALRPDVIIMDITMPVLGGIEATRIISEAVPSTRIVILSMHGTIEHIFRAMRAGARGYLLKAAASSELVDAIRSVMGGQRYFGRDIDPPDRFTHDSQVISASLLDSLSIREHEVMQYVVEGKTSVEIAQLLSLSPKSVETYRSRLMLKLGTDNIPALVKFALKHGVILS